MRSYYIVRRGNVSVPDMYKFDGIYRYSPKFATNWRSVVALFVGFAPPLPGFINSIDQGNLGVALAGQHM
jgi:NCS1 family nucleobase:cation symporter-1